MKASSNEEAFFMGVENTMALLPSKELLNGTKDPETTTGEFRVALGHVHEYLSDLLGADSSDKWEARARLGAMEKYCTEADGTADNLTATFTQAIQKPVHGMTVVVRAATANLASAPTFRADETGALVIVKGNNKPLAVGDIAGAGHWIELKYDEPLNKWVLQNPATGIGFDAAEKADIVAVQQGTYLACIGGGSGDAMTGYFSPALETLQNGQVVHIRACGPNTIATPTFKADETAALPIVKGYNQPLAAGDIAGDGHWLDLLYDSYLKKWVLQNPAKGIAIDSVPAGSVHYFATQTPPDGYLVANGALVSRTVYARLFSAIGTTFGEGDGGSTFQLPDLRGEFLRGWDAARNLDPERGFGTVQGDAIRNIIGTFGGNDQERRFLSGPFYYIGTDGGGKTGSSNGTDNFGFDASRVVPTANENRPHNVALLACIKY
ncbi:hypothetical protein BRW84_06955 [Oxalobacter formigenes OXCC13]|uniref:Phage Tail Collar Domain protein n=3 Tax=Oxalobacter TaxID=846 RepID=C3X912_OXAFO|nr:hypothetical protein BRW84_06955 [Oxalobacter formigenes OXCC13]EEO29688.1 phage Tail Collar Domain protein [Oxalobacter formigenes OXCC13]